MKFDRSNKFDLCYSGQVNSLRLKSSAASNGQANTFGGNIYIAVNGTCRVECPVPVHDASSRPLGTKNLPE